MKFIFWSAAGFIAIGLIVSACQGSDSDKATKAIKTIDSSVVSCKPAWQDYATESDLPSSEKARLSGLAAAWQTWNCLLDHPRKDQLDLRGASDHWCYTYDEDTDVAG